MKHSLIVGPLLLISACGSGSVSTAPTPPCQGAVVLGNWSGSVNGSPDTLNFNASCGGSSSYCQSQFSCPACTANAPSSGTVLIEVLSSNGKPGCSPAGQYTYSYTVSGNQLTFGANGQSVTYTRQ